MPECAQHAGACYMLRRNLPLWKAVRTIEETIAFCVENDVGEIIWKVDAEAFNHGLTPIPLIEKFIPWLEKARDAQAREGIVFSINPWVTMNHAGRARYPDGPPPAWHWRVRPNGEQALERACPLAPGWRQWIIEAYRLYATTKPDKLWLEDDFKTFVDNGSLLGCYCEAHLATFSERVGETVTREALVERITRPGEPDPIRAIWFDFQGEILVDVCRELEGAVHAESPQTRLGQMQSWSTDGRWWDAAMRALAGPLRPLARTSLASYNETRAIDFLPDNFDVLKETACLPPGTENCPELENCGYTPYAKGMNVTRLQLILSQVIGNRAITMNLFDMTGTDTSGDPRVGAMLKRTKPFLDGIATLVGDGGTLRGVSVPYPKRYADTVHIEPGQGFSAFHFDGEGWMTALQGAGIPAFLNGEAPVTALTGQSVRSLGAGEIERILAGGALLDGSAAAVLVELGFGDRVGVDASAPVDRDSILISAERDGDADAPESDPVYISQRSVTRGDTRLYPLTPFPGARVASTFLDNEHAVVGPAIVLFENASGGRVATYSLDLSSRIEPGFMSWHRRRQLQRIMRWLARDRVALFADGGAWMMPVRRDFPDYAMLAVLNFETDPWDDVTLTFDWDGGPENVRFESLEKTGKLASAAPAHIAKEDTNIVARFDRPVAALDALVLRVSQAR